MIRHPPPDPVAYWALPGWWGLATASVALLLLAAKAHGRQVRLEREVAGYERVTFGGENPPFVVALWRRDRRRFWTIAPLAALVLAPAAAVLGGPASLGGGAGLATLAAALWAPVAAFAVCGLLSLRGFREAAKAAPPKRSAWARAAARASGAWWAGVAAGAAAVAAALAVAP